MLRKVNIVNWDSPAATQAHREFGLEMLPHVRVFGKKGDLLADLPGVNPGGVEDAIRTGLN